VLYCKVLVDISGTIQNIVQLLFTTWIPTNCIEDNRHKMSNSLTLSLPEDALISVLCRVPASDHNSLWNTCSTFRKAIVSDVYASERATTNYAEVQARLIPGEELYGPELYDDEFRNYEPPSSPTTPEEIEMKNRYEAKLLQQRQEDINESYKALGYREEYGVINITIDITIDKVLAGEVSLVLIPRPKHGVLFHQAGKSAFVMFRHVHLSFHMC